jgi:Skp family chaperone for outer membrane proteins
MKKFLLLTAVALALPAAGYAQGLKVGTVDMNRAFKEYNRTKDSEKKINEARTRPRKSLMIGPRTTRRRWKRSTSSPSSSIRRP